MTRLTYPRTPDTIATKARMALGAYVAAPVREAEDALHGSLQDMWGYAYFATENADGPEWARLGKELGTCMQELTTAAQVPGDGPRHVTESTAMLITGFERAARLPLAPLPYDGHGRYAPAPGTEYPFAVSDIGRAAVQILGPTWHAESLPWGVGAYIEEEGEAFGYKLGVDEDGDLYVADDARGGNHTDLDYTCSADGLDALAQRVADLLLSLHTTTD
ncbi:hypothetical protein [Streptomyces sp. NPDC059003]|uniref:hypothetical protein n=1 Tax=Streptomyces sp. NPDC059003 TaxID=3346691 RepID=UPI0036CFD758